METDVGSSSVSLVEVTIVKQLHSGKNPGITEVQPEMLKALDVEGMSWMTYLFNTA